MGERITPVAEAALGVDCIYPSLRSCNLDLGSLVISLGLEDELHAVDETNDEVGDVVVHLAVVQIRDGETQALVLDERLQPRL